MIILNSVVKKFRRQDRALFSNLSLLIPPGAHIAILGGRQSGKTTLLRLLCGLELPTSGYVERTMSVSLPVGYNGKVYKKTTVGQFLRYAARIHSLDPEELVTIVLRTSGVATELKRPFIELPTADRRRINYVLSLALPMDCYLFDETIGLGSKSDRAMLNSLYEARSTSAAIVFASSSSQAIRKFCATGAILYTLHNGQLFRRQDPELAIRRFERLFASTNLRAPKRVTAAPDEEDED